MAYTIEMEAKARADSLSVVPELEKLGMKPPLTVYESVYTRNVDPEPASGQKAVYQTLESAAIAFCYLRLAERYAGYTIIEPEKIVDATGKTFSL